jgi:hypothetical protein
MFLEPAMTLAAVDRLVHNLNILEMIVDSSRRCAGGAGFTSKKGPFNVARRFIPRFHRPR